MLYSQYHWNEPKITDEQVKGLSEELSVSHLMSRLLLNRGIDSKSTAEQFLRPSDEVLHDPYLMKGMQQAVPRIREALDQGEHILIYGDYDADGVSSTSLMIYLMRELSASYDIYIPHRANEGYGLHNHALDWAHQQGVTLVITVDTGISAVEQIAYAKTLGMDVIVTDHHEPPEVLPEAYALINPKQKDCPYPFKGLAGVGVAMKLAEALLGSVPRAWMEIVTIGTVADLMPLIDENRVIVQRGIEEMRDSSFPGIRALLEISGVDMPTVNSTNVAFALAPRINASGRLAHAGRAVSLLTTEDPLEAAHLAEELDLLNRERQQVVEQMTQEAFEILEQKKVDGKVPDVIVVAGEGWNPGVVGIVASKVLERYYRPTLILGIDPATGKCKGSARSTPGLDMYEALTACKDIMDHYGGHPAAAGMTLHRDRLELLECKLNEYAGEVMKPEHFIPVTETDGECRISEVPLNVIEEMEQMQPFGMNNPTPKFIIRDATLMASRKMGKDLTHLKLTIEQDGKMLDAISFGKGKLADYIPEGSVIDVMGTLQINEWNGSRKPQFMMEDIRVKTRQVFDYRGCREPLEEMNTMIKDLSHRIIPNDGKIAVLVQEKNLFAIENHLYEKAIWVYDRKVGIVPWNDSAKKIGEKHLESLFVLDIPETAEQWTAMQSMIVKANNVILLYHTANPKQRLQRPSRDDFKRIYVLVSKWGQEAVPEKEMIEALSRQCGYSVRMMSKVMDVFEELSFIKRHSGTLTFVTNPPKQNLTDSRNYQDIEQLAEMEKAMFDLAAPQLMQWMKSQTKGAS
ncbi:single-stranded-DNA-specific exonuclease RecJ [Paenibacillus polygoni]|uniref:Single-stranded-DNA-specific exonuclease RecJ n=1 Tax=Paenibacillus polygoni TaxID=3050112 RepID=A0ABY8X379_9BACL|nr:single-stranded-DNA-specific exonuclease RecJ [Paenibacillus polygoni]WIV18444.1 single-stranded-DNA-specific exonuclease RecJ [Paenibacillus polygoni]